MRMRSLGIGRSALALAIVSTLLLPCEARSQELPEPARPIAVGSKVRVLAPTAIGGQVEGGHLKQHEIWRSVPLERVRISLAPTRGHGLGMSLSVRF
jgi:hypothetical protein